MHILVTVGVTLTDSTIRIRSGMALCKAITVICCPRFIDRNRAHDVTYTGDHDVTYTGGNATDLVLLC